MAVPRAAIVDTGPLVAFLDRGERHHAWTVEQVRTLDAPLLVCEPVLAEAMFLLARQPQAQDALFGLVVNGAVRIAFQVGDISPPCARCIASIATGRSRLPMPALCAWPSFLKNTWCLHWTRIFRCIERTVASRSISFSRREIDSGHRLPRRPRQPRW